MSGDDLSFLHTMKKYIAYARAKCAPVITAEAALRARQAALWRHVPPAQLLAAFPRNPAP